MEFLAQQILRILYKTAAFASALCKLGKGAERQEKLSKNINKYAMLRVLLLRQLAKVDGR